VRVEPVASMETRPVPPARFTNASRPETGDSITGDLRAEASA
jgi:hypothetical protein